jgi:hypothetical protein
MTAGLQRKIDELQRQLLAIKKRLSPSALSETVTPAAHVASHEAGGSDPLSNLTLLTADPATPADDSVWAVREGTSPNRTISIRARIFGLTVTIASISGITAEPKTWTQPTAGTSALRQRAAFRRQALRASFGSWQTVDLSTGPLPTQPQTWTSPIAGQYAFRQTQRVLRRQAVRASAGSWQTMDRSTGPLPTQPTTWTQPVSGTTALTKASKRFTGRAGRRSS